MPARLPFPLFIRQLARHALRELARWTRYILVGLIWICCLPWCIRQVWRGFIWLADGNHIDSQVADGFSNATGVISAAQASDTLLNNSTHLDHMDFNFDTALMSWGDITGVFGQSFLLRFLQYVLSFLFPSLSASFEKDHSQISTNSTDGLPARPPSLLSDVEFISAWSNSPIVNHATVDVIEGQLICVLLVTAFILVFLIREWVINQQPILNMPDPDAMENPPQEPQPENERPRMGILRPRNRRQGGDANLDVGDAALDPAARPIAVPRRRRALTDDNILNGADNDFDRPNMPIRSQSLLTNPEDMQDPRVEEAIGESSAVASEYGSRYVRRDGSNDVLPYKTLHPRAFDVYPDTSPSDFHWDDTSESMLRQREEEFEAERAEYFARQARRVSFAENVPIADVGATTAGDSEFQENVSDLDGMPIHTPDSSDAEPSQPPQGDLNHELQEYLRENEEYLRENAVHPRQDVVGNATLPDQDVQEVPEDASLLGQISNWLWHTDFEADNLVVIDTNTNPHREAQDEERIVEDVDAEAPFVPVHNQEAPIPALPPPVVEPAPVEPREPNMFMGVELNDPNVDDAEDLDGVLELLGMEGPIFGMVQNVIFSLFLITLTLMFSVWFPYMWGKIALLFLSHPTAMLIRAPLFVLSRSADIVVDVIFLVGGLAGFFVSQFLKVSGFVLTSISPSIKPFVDTSSFEGFTLHLSHKSGMRLEKTLIAALFGLAPDVPNFSMQSHHALVSFKTFIHNTIRYTASLFVQAHNTLTTRASARAALVSLAQTLRSVPGMVEKLPQVGQMASNFTRLVFTDLTVEPTLNQDSLDPSLAQWSNEDRILAIIVGYALFAVVGIVFLEIAHLFLGLKDDEKVEGYFADSLRQAGGVMKVIVIIGIEMLVFPLYCGLLLDIALLPLFANATIASRVAFMVRTPLTGIFIHWFIGTCYMFHFALFVSICRKIMRKGVLYFIRDPDDPTFHPVRDVLERPVPAQLGKIAFSALVYGGLVTICLGGVVWSIDWVGGVLPIQWATPEPRLAFPIDIIFYNFLLPFILRKAEPSKKISAMYKWWFRGCAKSLRLTNFLFGEEAPEEQYTHPRGFPWTLLIKNTTTEPQRDGTYVRAPASDSVRISKGRNVFLEVNAENERVDGVPDADFGMHGKQNPQFTKVYLPPNFRSRITTFIALLWLFAALTGATFTIGPLMVGRKITQYMAKSSRPPNDLYAFTVGVHVFAVVGYAIAYARPARDYLRAKVNSSGKQILASILHCFGLAYLAVFTTIVLPFVMALITELYIHMPVFDIWEMVNREKVNRGMSSTSVPPATATPIVTNPSQSHDTKLIPGSTIFILQSWTIGLLYLRLSLRLVTQVIDPNSRPARAIRAITRNGLLHADVPLASRAFVLPMATICLILLIFPVSYMSVIIKVLGIRDDDRKIRMYRFSYPLFLWMMANYAAVVFMRKKVEKWRVKIRDEVYLIGERLHNFHEPKPKLKGKAIEASAVEGKGKEKAL